MSQLKSRRVFRVYTYRGINVDDLMKMPMAQFCTLLPSKMRRHFLRGISEKEKQLVIDCIKSTRNVKTSEDKPAVVNTHCRSMVIVPQMINSIVGVHDGKNFVPIEIKADMIGYRLKDFVTTKKSSGHGRPGVGATSSSKFVPLK